MADINITTTSDPGTHLETRFTVNDQTRPHVETFAIGANLKLRLDGHVGRLTIAALGDDALEDLDIIGRFLGRCQSEVQAARRRLWACRGACDPATWASTSTWLCTSSPCTREEGHDGPHIACQPGPDHSTVHAARTWADEDEEVLS